MTKKELKKRLKPGMIIEARVGINDFYGILTKINKNNYEVYFFSDSSPDINLEGHYTTLGFDSISWGYNVYEGGQKINTVRSD